MKCTSAAAAAEIGGAIGCIENQKTGNVQKQRTFPVFAFSSSQAGKGTTGNLEMFVL